MSLKIISISRNSYEIKKYNVAFCIRYQEWTIESEDIKEKFITCNPNSIIKGLPAEYQWFSNNILMFNVNHKMTPKNLMLYNDRLIPVYTVDFNCSIAVQHNKNIYEQWNLTLNTNQLSGKDSKNINIRIDLHDYFDEWETNKNYKIGDYVIGPELNFDEQMDTLKKKKTASTRYVYKCTVNHKSVKFNNNQWETLVSQNDEGCFLDTSLGLFVWQKIINILPDYLLWHYPSYSYDIELDMDSGYKIQAWDMLEIIAGEFAGKYRVISCKKYFDTQHSKVIVKAHDILKKSKLTANVSKAANLLNKNSNKVRIYNVDYVKHETQDNRLFGGIEISRHIELQSNDRYKLSPEYIQDNKILPDFIDIYLNPDPDSESIINLDGDII